MAGSGKLVGKVIGKIFSYILNVLLTILLVILITGIIVGTVFAIYVKNHIDPEIDPAIFRMNSSQTTKIYYMEYTDRENRIGEMVEIKDEQLFGSENSVWVSYTQIPENLVDAFVAVEDKRFWSHNGVDIWRTGKAVLNYFIPGESSDAGGGSTITQQTIKNLTEEKDYTPQRKVQEILRALNLEKQLDKTQILELYLNNIYLSQNCYGVQAAAYTYFNKDVSELSLIECAAIASITNSPTRYDPIQNPDNNKTRRNKILGDMLEQGYITQTEYDSAYDKELMLDYQGRASDASITSNSWYTDQVMTEVAAALCQEKGYSLEMAYNLIYTGGLQIVTLQDPTVQSTLEAIYEDEGSFPKTNNAIQPQSSAVVIDPATGDVLGIVGARGEKSANLLLNFATQTTRSPGSSIKPLSVYAPALEYGLITYGSTFDDTPVMFNYADDDEEKLNPSAWPKNLPDVYGGLTTVNDAVTRSVNTVAVRVLLELTEDMSFDFVKNKLHMDSFIERATLSGGMPITDKDISALALGGMNYGVTNLEITAAYQIFANGGVYNKPRTWLKVLDAEGEVLLENHSESHIVISEQTASIMTKMLQNVVTKGTATAITLDNTIDCAGKTGTTSSDVDRWFVGYTPYYVCGIWFGYEIPQTLGTLAWSPCTVAWDKIMIELHRDEMNSGEVLKRFELADGVVTATYCKDSGKLMSTACYADPRGNRAETGYFTLATVPTEYCDRHVMVPYDSSTGAVASPKCSTVNAANVMNVGLIRVNRLFPMNIKVTDTQYTYREVSDDTVMPTTGDTAFYAGLYGEGEYFGYTATDSRYFNSFCYEHHALPDPEPEPDPDDTAEPDAGDGTDITDDTDEPDDDVPDDSPNTDTADGENPDDQQTDEISDPISDAVEENPDEE